MKRIIALFSMLLLITVTFAQTTSKPKKEDYLTPEQLLQYNKDLKIAELEKKVEQYGNWVGVGGEVGQAINEGLSAVVDVSEKFGKTDVGKFTMGMVAWKVMGRDLVKIIIGLMFLTIYMIFMFKAYKSTFTTRKLLIKNPGPFKYPKEYVYLKPNGAYNKKVKEVKDKDGNITETITTYEHDDSESSWESAMGYRLLYAGFLILGIAVTCIIIFSGK